LSDHEDLQLYDVATGAPALPWPGHRSPVEDVTFSADGKRLVTGALRTSRYPAEVLAWDVKTWKQTHYSFLFTPKFSNIRTPSVEHSIYIGKDGDDYYAFFDMVTGKRLGHLMGLDKSDHRDWGFFSPKGRFYVLENEINSKTVEELFEVPSGKFLCRLPEKGSNCAWAFSNDGKQVALFSAADGVVEVYETATGKRLRRLGKPPSLWANYATRTALAFSGDGKLLVSWNERDQDIQVWNLATGKESRRLPGKTSDVLCLALSPDGCMLAVGGMAGEYNIQLWELASSQLRRELTGHQGVVRSLAFSPDGRLLASGSADTTVLVWDVYGVPSR
jgi:dipeptidyl aminopeptidase/acylaminoacyl peptidase